MNKKGYSFSGWTEIAFVVILFIGVFTAVISEMNELYDTDYTLGIANTVNGTQVNLENQIDTGSDDILKGEAETSSDGLTLKSSWKILRGMGDTLWTFISGGFISIIIVDWMQLPDAVAVTLISLWLFSILLAFIMLLFRRKP